MHEIMVGEFVPAIELEDRESGEKRYVLEFEKEGGYFHLSGYDGFCMCESWYTPEEVNERYKMTGRVVNMRKLPYRDIECECEDHGHEHA